MLVSQSAPRMLRGWNPTLNRVAHLKTWFAAIPRKCNFCGQRVSGGIRLDCDCLYHNRCYTRHARGHDLCPVCAVPFSVRDFSVSVREMEDADGISAEVESVKLDVGEALHTDPEEDCPQGISLGGDAATDELRESGFLETDESQNERKYDKPPRTVLPADPMSSFLDGGPYSTIGVRGGFLVLPQRGTLPCGCLVVTGCDGCWPCSNSGYQTLVGRSDAGGIPLSRVQTTGVFGSRLSGSPSTGSDNQSVEMVEQGHRLTVGEGVVDVGRIVSASRLRVNVNVPGNGYNQGNTVYFHGCSSDRGGRSDVPLFLRTVAFHPTPVNNSTEQGEIVVSPYEPAPLAQQGVVIWRDGVDYDTSVSCSASDFGSDYLDEFDEMHDQLIDIGAVVPRWVAKQVVAPADLTPAHAIIRAPVADHKVGDFGGPGDDGDLLVNFVGRNLQLSKHHFKEYDLPDIGLSWFGEEAFQKVYAHYPANFTGFSWSRGLCKVLLPPCLVEPACAYAILRKHDREAFEDLQKHVVELLYNVRVSSPEFYRFMVEITPFVVWKSVNNVKLHGLQRYVDGEYWNCLRIRQRFCGCFCLIFCLLLLLGGLAAAGVETYDHFK